MFLKGVEVERIRLAGRWRNTATLDHYIQEAAATMVLQQLPESTLVLAQQLQASGRAFRSPPVAPWPAFFARRRQWTHW